MAVKKGQESGFVLQFETVKFLWIFVKISPFCRGFGNELNFLAKTKRDFIGKFFHKRNLDDISRIRT